MASYTANCEKCNEVVRFSSRKAYDQSARPVLCYSCKEVVRKEEEARESAALTTYLSSIERWSQKNGPVENLYTELKADVDDKAARLARDFDYMAEQMTRAAATLRVRLYSRKPCETYLGINSLGEDQSRGNELDRKTGELFATLSALVQVEHAAWRQMKKAASSIVLDKGISDQPTESTPTDN